MIGKLSSAIPPFGTRLETANEVAVAEPVQTRVEMDAVPAVVAADDEVPHPVSGPCGVVADPPGVNLSLPRSPFTMSLPLPPLTQSFARPPKAIIAVLAVQVVVPLPAGHKVAATPREYGVVPVCAENGVGPVRAEAIASMTTYGFC